MKKVTLTDQSDSVQGWPRWLRRLCAGVLTLGAGAGIGWAATAVFVPPDDVLDEAAFTYTKLVEGEVGSSITLNATAEWPQQSVGTNQASGTVTSILVQPGDEVQPGQALYTVNLRPVLVAQGSTPAFRPLVRASEGEDVRQLQVLLAALGLYDGQTDGEFGAATEQAVRDLQDSLGVPDDGVVQPGDLVFVPTLPGRVTLDEDVLFRGAAVVSGESVVSALAPVPEFSVAASVSQAAMMPAGTKVELSVDDATWVGVVASQSADPESPETVRVLLEGEGDVPLCADACSLIPIVGQTILKATVITQEAVAGIVVPSSALLSGADGEISVVDQAGRQHDIAVVATARGMSVIEGARAGMKVRIPADTADSK